MLDAEERELSARARDDATSLWTVRELPRAELLLAIVP
jgi:hypothetical protein